MPILPLVFLLVPACYSQSGTLTFKYPEYYLPAEDLVVTYEYYLRDSSYQEKQLFQRKGRTFVQVDDINNRDYVRLRESSLYYSDDTGEDMVLCLKYPLFGGKTWREGNTINVEVLATRETVQVGTHFFDNCLKILKTWPEDIVAEDPEESQPIVEIYAPGRWLVAKTGYPDMSPQQVQVGVEKYTGQFKTYSSLQEKLKLRENELRLDSIVKPAGSQK